MIIAQVPGSADSAIERVSYAVALAIAPAQLAV